VTVAPTSYSARNGFDEAKAQSPRRSVGAPQSASDSLPDPLPVVRQTVRALLVASPAYRELEAPRRRELAEAMVNVCLRAAALLKAEAEANGEIAAAKTAGAESSPPVPNPPRRSGLARAQSAGSEFSGVAAERVAGTTRAILNAVSFPRFVNELINGVFKAMLDSSRQQMQSYVELLNNVSASLDGFADSNLGNDRARQWLAERYPGSFMVEGESEDEGWGDEKGRPERDAWGESPEAPERTLRLRPGAAMPSAEALRTDLGLGPDETMPTGDPERALVPLARRALARQRQQMLATMVMLGMQRIVIDSGRINASMRFHIDTRSAAQEDRGSQFDFRNTLTGSGSFGFGPWGASASMTNTIGYVSTQRTQTTEEMNTDLDLNSSVELVFKTDYLPLERMAGQGQIDRIKVNTLNPEAEAKAAAEARTAREKRIEQSDTARRAALDKSIAPPPAPPAQPKPGEPGSPEAADKARKEAAERAKAKQKPEGTTAPQTGSPQPTAPQTGSPQPTAPQTGSPQPTAPQTGSPQPTAPQTGSPQPTATTPRTQSLSLADSSDTRDSPAVIRAPFVPSAEEAVEEMLALARIQKGDLVYDLGCGDGRVVIAAARKHGCRSVGVDVDSRRVAESRRNVQQNHLGHLVRIEQRDLFEVDLSEADVVFAYLLPELNPKLIPQFEAMKPGARIVSQDFDMAGIIPDRVVQVYLGKHRFYKTFYLWSTPLKRSRTPVRHQWSNARGLELASVR
jgi:predicted O-methyltransferase YrrM